MKDEIRTELEQEKLEFEEPELEIIEFSGSDIVTTSGDIDVPIIDPPGGGGGEDIDTPIFDDEGTDEGGDESYDNGGDEGTDEGTDEGSVEE